MVGNPIVRKCLMVGIILLLVGTCIIPAIAQDIENILPSSRGSWLYVGGSGPGNYTKIQDAINDSSDGDTIFVYDDSSPYKEKIVVNKSIDLLGENKETTIIENNGTIVFFTANKVQISSFTIQHSDKGSSTGIKGSTSDNIISNNIIQGHLYGIFLFGDNNTIYNNFILNNGEGIRLDSLNVITSINNTIYRNEISNSQTYSIFIDLSYSNRIYENNFIKNTSMIQHVWWIYDLVHYITHPLKRNQWYNNYWDIPRIGPKLIPGLLSYFWGDEYAGIPFIFPWCQIDLHPSREPYDIPGTS